MKKIRTILAYYNGEKFIDEQLQSIVDQEIPEGYKHEIYVYNDGSRQESTDYLERWRNKVTIFMHKNAGPTKRNLLAILDAKRDGVDIVFLADQDDVFLQKKYLKHLEKHNEGEKLVISGAVHWYYETNSFGTNRMLNNWDGHRTSFDLSAINEWDLKEFEHIINELDKSPLTKKYHDCFVGILFGILNEGPCFIADVLTKYRVNSNSITFGPKTKQIKKIWANQYDYYFDVMKPLFEKSGKIKLNISTFNKVYIFYDDNFFKRKTLAIFRFYWNNLAMYLRFRAMRNIF